MENKAFDIFAALEDISKLGKLTKDVKVDNLSITLSTLDSEQEGLVFITSSEFTGNAYFYKMKAETLKYAIRAVNGIKLDVYTEASPEKIESLKDETLSKLEKIIAKWDENVVSFLYNEWVELTKESEKILISKGIMKQEELPEEKK
jgi:hypothetical protein